MGKKIGVSQDALIEKLTVQQSAIAASDAVVSAIEFDEIVPREKVRC